MQYRFVPAIALIACLGFGPGASGSPTISPAKRTLIENLMRVSEGYVLGADFLIQILQVSAPTPVDEAQKATLRARILADPGTQKLLQDNFVELYDRSFNEGELRDLIAFFGTPLGHKYADLQVLLGTEGRGKLAAEAVRQLSDSVQISKVQRTLSDMRMLGAACQAYATDFNGHYPNAQSIQELGTMVGPTYVRTPARNDRWGKPLAYFVTPDQKHYRIVSGGADEKTEPSSLRPQSKAAGNDDIIYEDGHFVQQPQPVGASSSVDSGHRPWDILLIQNGAVVALDGAGVGNLKRVPFTIRFKSQKNVPLMLNALEDDTNFKRIQPGFRMAEDCLGEPLPPFCGGTGMAEDDFNSAKRIVPSKGAVHSIHYTSDTDHRWSRVDPRAGIFDRDVAFIGDTPIEKTSMARLLLTFVARDNDDGVLREDEIRKITIRFR